MPYKITYEKEGVSKSMQRASYYESICLKNRLSRKGYKCTLVECGVIGKKPVPLVRLSRAERELVKNWIKNADTVSLR